MVYAFTETEKKIINDSGYSVIEFKRAIKKMGATAKLLSDTWKIIMEAAKKICESIVEFTESFNFAINEISHKIGWNTNNRYKTVYMLSKCTGIERKCVWKLTRPLYLPRSNC